MRVQRNKKGFERLNLIPILDAVFIFIFFLLMSAQFVEIYEIGSDAPAVSTIKPDQKQKEPLNLTLLMNRKAISVLTGLEGRIYKKIIISEDKGHLEKLKNIFIQLKQSNIDEESVILKPQRSVPYKAIVEVMDVARTSLPVGLEISGKNKAGNQKKTSTLFNQIIFETI